MDDWSDSELTIAVITYREMQDEIAAGHAPNKRSTYRKLAASTGRSAKSIEYRMQNISAVLNDLGQPWIPGLKPAANVGSNVSDRIKSTLADIARQRDIYNPRNSLSNLRPTARISVYDVLCELGFDVEQWRFDAADRPIANPAENGRAYSWSYRDQASNRHLFMLWYDDMELYDGSIRYRQCWNSYIQTLEKTRRQTAKRATNFLWHIATLKVGTPVHVGVVEGSRAKSADTDPSQVNRRALDAEPWHLSHWDPFTQTFEFTRGVYAHVDEQKAVNDARETREIKGYDDEAIRTQDVVDVCQSNRSATEKEQLVSARLGQGRFRQDVLSRWNSACAVTGSSTLQAIRASHCMPWRQSSDEERLDPANGLPLVATLDALFDAGLISFDSDGSILISPRLEDLTLALEGLTLRRHPREDEQAYLAYHRQKVFLP
ncbi:HNH endonuclease [Dyella sp. C9]|uniref:HNH endonuclease n=1 Tax=Dyella sp. C9 TaxID=2202154 RepID=UPI0018E55397|nr:HNH endonuclease [Dyella sp. C9]